MFKRGELVVVFPQVKSALRGTVVLDERVDQKLEQFEGMIVL